MAANGVEARKTKVVASTRGNTEFPDVKVDGKPVTIGLNAYIK